jgi:hypothetical protein
MLKKQLRLDPSVLIMNMTLIIIVPLLFLIALENTQPVIYWEKVLIVEQAERG